MRCVAVGCKTGRKSGLRIHSFPTEPKRRLEWAVKVNIAEGGKLWVPKAGTRYGVCEAHFEEDQYEPRRTDRKLKRFAVPTIFNHRKPPKRRRKLVKHDTPPPIPVIVSVQTETLTEEPLAEDAPAEEGPVETSGVMAASIAASNDHTYLAPRCDDKRGGQAKPVMVTTVATSELGGTRAPRTLLKPMAALNVTTTVASSQLMTIRPMGSMPRPTTNMVSVLLPNRTTNQNTTMAANPTLTTTGIVRPQGIATFTTTGAIQPQSISTFTTMGSVGPQGIVLPQLNCMPNSGPIFLVPVNKVAQQANLVPVPMSRSQLPIILSVESLQQQLQQHPTKPPLVSKPLSYDQLQAEAVRLNGRLEELKTELAESGKQIVKVKASLAKQTERLSKFLDLDQIESIQRLPDDKVKWREKTLKFALDLYMCSAAAYKKLLDSHYPLPSEHCLRKYCVDNNIKEGVPPELLNLEDACVEEDDNTNIIWL